MRQYFSRIERASLPDIYWRFAGLEETSEILRRSIRCSVFEEVEPGYIYTISSYERNISS